MKLRDAIEKIGADEALRLAKDIAMENGINWAESIGFVFSVIVNDVERVPGNIGGKDDNESIAIGKWVSKYQAGYNGRASQRVSNPLGTVADPIIEKIIGARLTDLTEDDLKKITSAHRLGMSAENILGLILEEYLSNNLLGHGWHCAWGETVKSVDFVHEDGSLLQIKNRSNSENSSSMAVRNGTEIKKWYRVKSDRVEYMWNKLNEVCGSNHLSEESFVSFVKQILTSNPDCLAVEQDNLWQ